MKTGHLIAIAVFLALIYFIKQKDNDMKFSNVTKPLKRRKCDSFGCGNFGARRANGTRKHQGLDFLAQFGKSVFSPISGKVRLLKPYKNDSRFDGIEIYGKVYSVKVMYFVPELKNGDFVQEGQYIGRVQNLAIKYGPIPNHLHVEVRSAGILRDPTEFFNEDTVLVA